MFFAGISRDVVPKCSKWVFLLYTSAHSIQPISRKKRMWCSRACKILIMSNHRVGYESKLDACPKIGSFTSANPESICGSPGQFDPSPFGQKTFPHFAPSWLRSMLMLLTALVAAQFQQRLPSMWHFATCALPTAGKLELQDQKTESEDPEPMRIEPWLALPNHMLCLNGNTCQVSKFIEQCNNDVLCQCCYRKCATAQEQMVLWARRWVESVPQLSLQLCFAQLDTFVPQKAENTESSSTRNGLAGQQSWICQPIKLQSLGSFFVVLEQK